MTAPALDTNLALGNLAGLPCVGIPIGNGASLLFAGAIYDDARILEAAMAYPAASGYQWQSPPSFP